MRRILFVSRTFPGTFEQSVHGVHQRLRLFLEAAASIAERLDILFLVEEEFVVALDPVEYAGRLETHWGIAAQVHFAAREPDTGSWVRTNLFPLWNVREHPHVRKAGGRRQADAVSRLLETPTDLVVAFKFESALPVVRLKSRPPMALDLDDIEFVKMPRMLARPPHHLLKILEFAHWPAFFLGERAAIRASAVSFVCSKSARRGLQRLARSTHIDVAPNAARFPDGDRSDVSRAATHPPTLLFVGTYAYPPNLEAAELLVQKIFPLILDRIPDARLVLVGTQVERVDLGKEPPRNVELRGFVPDLRSIYAEADLVACPILAGGGTRTKIIEAAACRVPVVSTTLGAEGIEFEDGKEIVLRDRPTAFAQACVELLRDRPRAEAIAAAAFERARIYDRDVVIAGIARDLVAAFERAAVSAPGFHASSEWTRRPPTPSRPSPG